MDPYYDPFGDEKPVLYAFASCESIFAKLEFADEVKVCLPEGSGVTIVDGEADKSTVTDTPILVIGTKLPEQASKTEEINDDTSGGCLPESTNPNLCVATEPSSSSDSSGYVTEKAYSMHTDSGFSQLQSSVPHSMPCGNSLYDSDNDFLVDLAVDEQCDGTECQDDSGHKEPSISSEPYHTQAPADYDRLATCIPNGRSINSSDSS